jgi:hypothetical protein
MNEKNLNEGQWEDRKQWSLGVGQRRKHFETYVYILRRYLDMPFFYSVDEFLGTFTKL